MTYYDVLGVSRTANCATIKKAYRELVKLYHPDASNADTNDKFIKITEIYNTLVDPDKRKLYDDSIKSSIEKLNDQLSKIEISVTESIKGCIKKFSFYYTKECTCGTKKMPCPVCKGKGFVVSYGDRIKTCPTCEGHKFSNERQCRLCYGSGEVRKYASSEVIVPAGVEDGKIINCITDQGVKSVKINIVKTSEDIYTRKGNDLIYEAKIDPITALIGGVIYIPTIDGNYELNIRENSSNEKLYKLANHGIPCTNGSLYIVVRIDYNATDKSLIPKIRSVVLNGK